MLKKKEINHRVKLTKYLIREALLELLKTHNINKISILELCKVAGVNRSTFYNHYGSQYDVLNEIADIYVQSTSYVVMNDLSEGKSIHQSMSHVLQYIKDNLEFIKLILSQDNYDLMANITVSFPRFDSVLIEALPKNMDLYEKRAISSYVQYGAVKLLKEWILSDCPISPEEEAKLILSIAGRTIGNFK